MNANKRKKLEAAGWRVGSADAFLELTKAESALVDIRLALSHLLKERRTKLHLSQRDLAERIQSSQSRVAKMEAGAPDVSFDQLMRGIFAIGVSRRDVAKAIAR